MRMIKFPSIEQFRTVVKNITDHSSYVGQDEDNKPIFDYLKPKPVLKFIGTVKLHGTNAAVCFNNRDGLYVQSKKNIITPEKDNSACAFNVMQNKDYWMDIIVDLVNEYHIDVNTHTISIYFEWAGKGIQKGVGISEIDKASFIFTQFKVSPIESLENEKSIWLSTIVNDIPIKDINGRIFNIRDFKMYEVEIDFNDPVRIQNYLNELTLEVEEECPVAKAFGVSGVGEGIVWETIWEDSRYVFKVKGDKHSNSKVKTLQPIDAEKLDKIDKCIGEICHNWRFEQALVEVFGPDYEKTIDRKKMGDYLKWVATDILKEESDIIASYGFEPKDIMGKVQGKAKEYFYAVESL